MAILRNKANKELEFEINPQITFSLSVNTSVLPIPNTEPPQAITINLGISRLYRVSIRLVDDGTDRSAGDGIITIDDQWEYLSETVITNKIDEEYFFFWQLPQGKAFIKTVIVKSVDLPVPNSATTEYEGSLILEIADNVLS